MTLQCEYLSQRPIRPQFLSFRNNPDVFVMTYCKNLKHWTVCYQVQNSLLWKRSKNTAKARSISPHRDRKKNKSFLTLVGEESPTT